LRGWPSASTYGNMSAQLNAWPTGWKRSIVNEFGIALRGLTPN